MITPTAAASSKVDPRYEISTNTRFLAWRSVADVLRPPLRLDRETHGVDGKFATLLEAYESNEPCLVHPNKFSIAIDLDYTELAGLPTSRQEDQIRELGQGLVDLRRRAAATLSCRSGRAITTKSGVNLENLHIFLFATDLEQWQELAHYAGRLGQGATARVGQASRPPFSPYHKNPSFDHGQAAGASASLIMSSLFLAFEMERRVAEYGSLPPRGAYPQYHAPWLHDDAPAALLCFAYRLGLTSFDPEHKFRGRDIPAVFLKPLSERRPEDWPRINIANYIPNLHGPVMSVSPPGPVATPTVSPIEPKPPGRQAPTDKGTHVVPYAATGAAAVYGDLPPATLRLLALDPSKGARSEAMFSATLSLLRRGIDRDRAFRIVAASPVGRKLAEYKHDLGQAYFRRLCLKAESVISKQPIDAWKDAKRSRMAALMSRYYREQVATNGHQYRDRNTHAVAIALFHLAITHGVDIQSISFRQIQSHCGLSLGAVTNAMRKLRDRNHIKRIRRDATRAASNAYEFVCPSDLDIEFELNHMSEQVAQILALDLETLTTLSLLKKSARQETQTRQLPTPSSPLPLKKTLTNQCPGFGYQLGKVCEILTLGQSPMSIDQILQSAFPDKRPSGNTRRKWLERIASGVKTGIILANPDSTYSPAPLGVIVGHPKTQHALSWLRKHRETIARQQAYYAEEYQDRSALLIGRRTSGHRHRSREPARIAA